MRGYRRIRITVLLGVAAATALAVPAEAAESTVVWVRPSEAGAPVSPALLGTNHRTTYNAHGMWDPQRRQVVPEVLDGSTRAGLGLVRFPGGTEANLYDWKRAIGPVEDRRCQTDARGGGGDGPFQSSYGVDEYMAYLDRIGGQAQIMMPFANESPGDAADWVEYMNAEVGSNPNGGVAWADRRAGNGHPEPYGVTWWEIGNEHDRLVERYWMSADNDRAIRQYAFGGTEPKTAEPVARECDHRASASVSDGDAGQRFEVQNPPVVPDSQTVYVDGTPWRAVADLATAGPDDPVYGFDPETGEIRFGDGTHGRIPPAKAKLTADYESGPHPGFVDFYAAMKEVDPDIDVCTNWAPVTDATGLGGTSFPELMAAEGKGDRYDCMTIHPYTNFDRDFGSGTDNPWDTAVRGHDQHMIGDALATKLVDDLRTEVKRYGRKDAYVALTEFGALWGPRRDNPAFPEWNTSLSHALYMASQWAGYANRGTPWAVGNALIDRGSPRTVIGPGPDFVFTSEAVLREAMKPLVASGARVVANEVAGNPVRRAADGSYKVLATTATRAGDGTVHLMVVNRDPDQAVTGRVTLTGDVSGTARVGTVNAADFTSYNSAEHPDAVSVSRSTREVSGGGFSFSFPAHSVTLFALPYRGEG